MSDRDRTPESLHELAAAYALDALEEAERERFEAHYPTCESCSREVDELRRTAALLGEVEAVGPPPEMKNDVLARIRSTDQLPPDAAVPEPSTSEPSRPGAEPEPAASPTADLTARRARASRRWPLLAAAVVIAVAGLVAVWRTSSTLSPQDEYAALLEEPDVVVTELEGEGGMITIAWSPRLDEVGVSASGLADPAAGRAYALWLLQDDGPVPAGLFVPDDGEVVQVLTVADLDSLGWGVTVEPVGGSDEPTTEIIFSGAT